MTPQGQEYLLGYFRKSLSPASTQGLCPFKWPLLIFTLLILSITSQWKLKLHFFFSCLEPLTLLALTGNMAQL